MIILIARFILPNKLNWIEGAFSIDYKDRQKCNDIHLQVKHCEFQALLSTVKSGVHFICINSMRIHDSMISLSFVKWKEQQIWH